MKKLKFFILFSFIFSNLFSSIPNWVFDTSEKDKNKYWVGVGIVTIAGLQPGVDPSMAAYLNAVEKIAAQS